MLYLGKPTFTLNVNVQPFFLKHNYNHCVGRFFWCFDFKIDS